jgi:plasmid maintenance system antidote protein VapI
MAKKTPKIKRCEPLERYCELHGISAAELARRLEMAATTVRSMVNGWRPVTAETAVYIEKKIGVNRDTLRPDIFVRRV